VDTPEVRYAKTPEGVHIAYQVAGDGPVDLMLVGMGGYSNIEFFWRLPGAARYLGRLASLARIIQFDPRGLGLSDPLSVERLPTIETRMADTLAVMDVVGSERAALVGFDATGPLSIVFAATYPERTAALILFGTGCCGLRKTDYPWAWTEEQWEAYAREVEEGWGDPAWVEKFVRGLQPTLVTDDATIRTFTTFFRVAASPGTAAAMDRMERDTDVRHVLPSVQAPTLVMHRTGDQMYSVEEGRYLTEHIPGARFIELEGSDHSPWGGDIEAPMEEIERFLTSIRTEEAEFDRVLATVVFTDIVGSTQHAAAAGDRAWHELLERHHATVRAMLGRYHGREVDTAGDGFFATFDGPARAIRCAIAIADAVQALGLEIRAGLHTGEVELHGDDVRGIAVHIGSRIEALAGPSEVLVSSTVKDLVAGSGLAFDDAGEHELKGVPDRWRLYRVLSEPA
jgi:class 3 adenylate cyclase